MFVNVIMYANQGLLSEDIQYSMLELHALQSVFDTFSYIIGKIMWEKSYTPHKLDLAYM